MTVLFHAVTASFTAPATLLTVLVALSPLFIVPTALFVVFMARHMDFTAPFVAPLTAIMAQVHGSVHGSADCVHGSVDGVRGSVDGAHASVDGGHGAQYLSGVLCSHDGFHAPTMAILSSLGAPCSLHAVDGCHGAQCLYGVLCSHHVQGSGRGYAWPGPPAVGYNSDGSNLV